MKINRFYLDEYLSYASYDNYRKIANYIDGLKPSARKCIHTILQKNISAPKKLDSLKSLIADSTNYIHGADSLIGVMVGMAQNFVGSNNMPLLCREGTFGTRVKPAHAAGRYISSCKESYLDYVFIKDDSDVLIEQIFDGDIIEPKYYIPILPLILINGSEGLSVGFAQKIFPRNVKEIISVIKKLLYNNEITEKLLPYYNNFNGDIIQREDGGYEILGKVKKIGMKLMITELPIGYDLKSYTKVLNTLEEKKIINEYIDLTDTKKDIFLFEIKMKNMDTLSDYDLLDTLKLIKRVSENFTVMDENNIIKVYDNALDIIKDFMNIRVEYYEKRKLNNIKKLEYDLKILMNKLRFIKDIIAGNISINNKTKQVISDQIDSIGKYDKIDNSYEYLLRMQIYSLTREKIAELTELYSKTKLELDELRNKDIKVWYSEDIDELIRKL